MRHVVLVIVLAGFLVTPLWAQGTDRRPGSASDQSGRPRLQVGAGFKTTLTPGAATTSALTPDFVWRWRGKTDRTDRHWSPSWGLSSIRSQVSSPLGVTSLPVGDLQARPVLLGMDYRIPRGRWQWSVGASLGWSLNRIETPHPYQHRAAIAGADDLWIDIDNSLVWGPRVKGWYDVNDRSSLLVEAAYLMTRPTLTLRAHGQTTTSRLNADALIVKVGIAYGIF